MALPSWLGIGLGAAAGLGNALGGDPRQRDAETLQYMKLKEGQGTWEETSGPGPGVVRYAGRHLKFVPYPELGEQGAIDLGLTKDVPRTRVTPSPFSGLGPQQAGADASAFAPDQPASLGPAFTKAPPAFQEGAGALPVMPTSTTTIEQRAIPGVAQTRLDPQTRLKVLLQAFADRKAAHQEALQLEANKRRQATLDRIYPPGGGVETGALPFPGAGQGQAPDLAPARPGPGAAPRAAPQVTLPGAQAAAAPSAQSAASPTAVDPKIYQAVIAGAKKRGIDPVLALAYMAQESDFNQSAGKEIGIGQFTRHTAQERGLDVARLASDPYYNIEESLNYFADLQKQHAGDPTAALASYNGGGDPRYVEHVNARLPAARAIFAQYGQAGTPAQAGTAPPVAAAQPPVSNGFENLPQPVLQRVAGVVQGSLGDRGEAVVGPEELARRLVGAGVPAARQDDATYTVYATRYRQLEDEVAKLRRARVVFAAPDARGKVNQQDVNDIDKQIGNMERRRDQIYKHVEDLQKEQRMAARDAAKTAAKPGEAAAIVEAKATPELAKEREQIPIKLELQAKEADAAAARKRQAMEQARTILESGPRSLETADKALIALRSRGLTEKDDPELHTQLEQYRTQNAPIKSPIARMAFVNPKTLEMTAKPVHTLQEAEDQELIPMEPKNRSALTDTKRTLIIMDKAEGLLAKVYGPGGVYKDVKTPASRVGGALSRMSNEFTEYKKEILALEPLFQSLSVNVERGVFGERGKTLMGLVKNAQGQLPKLFGFPDTQDAAYYKFAVLRNAIEGIARDAVPGSEVLNPTPTTEEIEQRIRGLEPQSSNTIEERLRQKHLAR